jgi:plastocyanin
MRLAWLFLVACGSDATQIDAGIDARVVDAPPDAVELVNGCTAAMAVDLTGPIQFDDDFYLPRCARIRAGDSVTWTGDFNDHPLAQPGSPITMITTGTSTTIAFPDAGAWAYYCPNHPPGMSGVIYVVP